jgi:hypothetical protein
VFYISVHRRCIWYQVEHLLSNTSSVYWNIEHLISNTSSVYWNIEHLLSNTSSVYWNIEHLISNTSSVYWNIEHLLSNTSSVYWNIETEDVFDIKCSIFQYTEDVFDIKCSIFQYTEDVFDSKCSIFQYTEDVFDSKCSIEWTFILTTLKHFGFNESFTIWVQTLYSNIQTCVMNNGWISEIFKNLCRICQGCALSALLFVLSVEIMPLRIWNNKDIKGFQIKIDEQTRSIKISQLADDTTLYFQSTTPLISIYH